MSSPSSSSGFANWQIQPWSTAGLKRIATAVVIVLIGYMAFLRTVFGVISGIGIGFGIFAYGYVLYWLLMRSERKRMSRAPSGTIFAGHGMVSRQSHSPHSRFDNFMAGRRGRVPVDLIVNRDGLTLIPLRSRQPWPMTIVWQEITSLNANREPVKPLIGLVTIRLSDGLGFSISVRDYRGLSNALIRIQNGA